MCFNEAEMVNVEPMVQFMDGSHRKVPVMFGVATPGMMEQLSIRHDEPRNSTSGKRSYSCRMAATSTRTAPTACVCPDRRVHQVYVFDLCTASEVSRKEGRKIVDGGSRNTVAIMLAQPRESRAALG
jgi:hypothetical protein